MTFTFPPSFAKSWKTTLIGLTSAVWAAVDFSQIHDWSVAIHDHAIQTKILFAIGMFIAKDANVTGGTSGQPSSPQALADANQQPSASSPPKITEPDKSTEISPASPVIKS